MLKLTHRSYPGRSYRPTPHVEQSKLLISIITPWNSKRIEAQKLAQSFADHYNSISSDIDKTRMQKPKPFLSDTEDAIYSICNLLNEEIFYKLNKDKIESGFEACFIIETVNEIIFAGIGHPHIYLDRKNLPLHPISLSSSTNDLESALNLDPLPQHLLGVYDEAPISISSIQKKEHDRFILVNRNYLPASFIGSTSKSLENLGDLLAQDNQNLPFWLGLVQIS